MENNTYTYHGIPGTRFIWHGEWSDPEVEYQGRLYNGNSLEDTLWSIYKTECEENGKEPSEEEFDNLPIDWFTNNFLDITMEDIDEAKNMKKNVIKLNEAQLRKVVAESVQKVLSELDYKTYFNAAKKRLQQYRDNPADKEKFDKYWELQKAANQSFDDDYVGLMKYDTMGDKMKGKHSPKFNAHIDVGRKDFPYQAIQGYNKSGNKLFTPKQGEYYSDNGYTTPKNFFRDSDVADAYTKANDELWDFYNGKYDFDSEKGWHLKESKLNAIIAESIKKVLANLNK